MKVEGVWGVEYHGLHGWERVSTAFLENGRYLAASANHYTVGSFKKEKNKFRAKARITQYGKVQVIFGTKSENFDVLIKGKIRNTGQIVGKILPISGGNFDVGIRLIRLDKLD